MKRLLSLFYLSYFALVGVYVIFMPKVLTQLGYTKAEVGIIYAAAPFIRFLLPFIFKYYVALTQRVYLFALVSTVITGIIFLLTVDNFYLYLFANVLLGASMGVTLPFVETIALHQLSKKTYGKVRLWGSVGFILIALWLGKVLNNPYEALYYLLGTALATLTFGYQVLQYDQHDTVEGQRDDKQFDVAKFWAFWISVFLMQMAFGGFYNFFTIYETERGFSLEITSWMWAFGVLCEIVMLYFQGALLQRNLLTILKISVLITAFRWLLLYLYPSTLWIVFASQSLHAVSFALYHSAAITYVFSLYTQKKLAQQFLLGMGFGLGAAVGALLSGQIYGEYIFLIEAVITLGAWRMLRVHEKRRENILNT